MSIPHFPLMVPDTRETGQFEVVAPYDLSPIATVGTADSTAVATALDTAHALFRNRDAWLSPARRIEILDRAATIMAERAEHLAVEAAREGGKPLLDSRVEVARAIDGVKICIETLRTDGGEEIPMGVNAASQNRLAFTHREPIGIVVAVSAFNHPLNLIVHQVGPAIATGCPVIVKPAHDTPLSCMRFVQILREAGLPDEWCQAMAIEDLDVATQLITDERVGFFSFIGSAKVGWMLRSKLAAGTRCALEHGGPAPVIVAADADIKQTAAILAKGGFYHAGQVCVSVQRIFAHASIAENLAHAIAAVGESMKVGDPTQEDTDIGPFIRPKELQRVHEWVLEAISGGAQCLSGGEPVSDTCYPATTLLHPASDSKVSTLEIFGPVVAVTAYTDIDNAIETANSLPFAFQAAVYTRDLDLAMKVYRRLDASAVMINDFTAFRVDWMPFAGLRQSGMGVGGIPHTMRDMQIEKLMVIKSDEL